MADINNNNDDEEQRVDKEVEQKIDAAVRVLFKTSVIRDSIAVTYTRDDLDRLRDQLKGNNHEEAYHVCSERSEFDRLLIMSPTVSPMLVCKKRLSYPLPLPVPSVSMRDLERIKETGAGHVENCWLDADRGLLHVLVRTEAAQSVFGRLRQAMVILKVQLDRPHANRGYIQQAVDWLFGREAPSTANDNNDSNGADVGAPPAKRRKVGDERNKD